MSADEGKVQDERNDDVPAADVSLFENLGNPVAGDGGRNQLTEAQRNAFAQPLADAAGIPRSNISIRALNDDKQTGRAAAETIAERVRANIEMLDWVFVGRCTGEEEKYSNIIRYMSEHAFYLAGISVFVGAKPTWRVIGVFYDKELEQTAKLICKFLGYDFSDAVEVKVRDRRNLTKDLSDYDDPVSSEIFLTDGARRELISEIMRKKCVAIQGPPGTGKTVVGKSISVEIAGTEDRVLPLQFHQSYSYEDFVRGWRPSKSGNLELKDGAFLQFCEYARTDPGNPYVVFIDEINRANVSQVFGEILSLIEATKRDEKFAVDLAYNSEQGSSKFYVPKNIFLVATMNTADRSLALVDFALRRRLSFIDLLPAYEEREFLDFICGNGLTRSIAEVISKRMNDLNSVISNDTRNLGPGFSIGHSYFCGKVPEGTDLNEWCQNIVLHEIAPLLREYWAEEEELAAERVSILLQDFEAPGVADTPAT